MNYIFSVLVENHAGVLARISQLFSAGGFNSTSLSVGETEDQTVSLMPIVVDGYEQIERVVKPFGNGGAHIGALAEWIGMKVVVIRIEEVKKDAD